MDAFELRQVAIIKQSALLGLTDQVAGYHFQIDETKKVAAAMLPLQGAWGSGISPVCVALIWSFLKPEKETYEMMPPLNNAENDPALPYHQFHWLRGEFPMVLCVPPAIECCRLRATIEGLDAHIDHDINALEKGKLMLTYWSNLAFRLENKLAGIDPSTLVIAVDE